jgi:hypothetical protein
VSPNEQRYTAIAIVLHWAIAAAILSNLFVGWSACVLFSQYPACVTPVHADRSALALVIERFPQPTCSACFTGACYLVYARSSC